MWSLFTLGGERYWNNIFHKQVKVPRSFRAIMQVKGDFVVYYKTGDDFNALWTTRTHDKGDDYWAIMQDDGNLCIKRKGDIKGSPIWCSNTSDRLDKKNIELAEMVYDSKNAIVKLNGDKPKSSISNIAINGTKQPQAATLTMSYTDTVSKSWKTSTTLKIGIKSSFKVGAPSLAEGKAEVSQETSQTFEWNETTTKSETKTISLPVQVDPGQGIQGRCTWSESTLTVPYGVKGKGTFGSGKKVPISLNGTYEGIVSHDIRTIWMPYTESEEASVRAMLAAAPSMVLP